MARRGRCAQEVIGHAAEKSRCGFRTSDDQSVRVRDELGVGEAVFFAARAHHEVHEVATIALVSGC